MQVERPQKFADALAQLYERQDYAGIVSYYDAPGAIYLDDDVIVWSSKDNLVSLLRSHCAANRSLGVHRVVPKVAAQGLPVRNHVTLWVDWHHFDKDGAELFVFKVRYFCRFSHKGFPVIQLVEALDQPGCYREANIDWRMPLTA